MSYKYSKGPTVQGDIAARPDVQRDTKINFEEDYIALEASGSAVLVVSGSKVGVGLTNPSHKFDVNGDIRVRGNDIRDNSGNPAISFDGSANTAISNHLEVSGNVTVTGSIITTNDISFQDNAGTFPTNTAGFFWDLNNDEARIYAKQPASDQIDFVFKLSDNNNSVDRYLFWIDDYRGGSHDRYPLVMHGENIYMHSTQTSEGVPDLSTAKINIPRGTDSATTTVHKGRVQLQGDNTSDLYIRFTQNSQNGYIFQDQSDSNALKVESHTHLSLNTNGANERLKIASGGAITFNDAYTFPTSDGSANQVLQTNGSGQLSFASVSGGGGSGGKVLQVVSTSFTGSMQTNSVTFTTVTDGSNTLQAAITPSNSSNKILIMVHVNVGIDTSTSATPRYAAFKMRRLRGGSGTFVLGGKGNQGNHQDDLIYNAVATDISADYERNMVYSMSGLDSPSTTSETTYRMEIRMSNSGVNGNINQVSNNENQVSTSPAISTITLIEIDGS